MEYSFLTNGSQLDFGLLHTKNKMSDKQQKTQQSQQLQHTRMCIRCRRVGEESKAVFNYCSRCIADAAALIAANPLPRRQSIPHSYFPPPPPSSSPQHYIPQCRPQDRERGVG